MRKRTTTVYGCTICGFESESQEEVQRCEDEGRPPKPEITVGEEVLLDARGLKTGNAYCRAVVTGISLQRCEQIVGHYRAEGHDWLVCLDRNVRLCECWGEGGMDLDPWSRSWVVADDLLDRSQTDSSWREVTALGDEIEDGVRET